MRHLLERQAARSAATGSLWARPATVGFSYLVVFAVLGAEWLRGMGDAVPVGPLLVSSGDAQVFTWTLAWVTHALLTAPRHLLDANVFYPAPAQLAGGEHFLSTQLFYAPAFLLSDNALWSANVVAFLSYPVAALAMQRLAVALGAAPASAWVAGLVFALGPLRVPANLHVVQYLNVYLALAALALTRLRERPDARRAAWLAIVLAAGALSSNYLAVMLAMTATLWAVIELRRDPTGRTRFAAAALAAAAVAALAFLAVALMYLRRGEAVEPTATDFTWQSQRLYLAFRDTPGVRELVDSIMAHAHGDRAVLGNPAAIMALAAGWAVRMVPRWLGIVPMLLSGLGALSVVSRSPPVRRLAARGWCVGALGFALMLGPALSIAGAHVPLPFAWLAASPLRFFRFPWRFVVLLGFGMALCTAAALEAARAALGARRGTVLALVAAAALLVSHGTQLVGDGLERIAAQTRPIYDLVRTTADAEQDPAPLLELPLTDPSGRSFEWEAMLGSTRHWLPLISGVRSYPPPHAEQILAAVQRLPADDALADLVDMTDVGWLLLRPASDWRDPPVRAALLRATGVEVVATRDDWTLARIRRASVHPEWFAAIAAGGRPPAPHTGPLSRALTTPR